MRLHCSSYLQTYAQKIELHKEPCAQWWLPAVWCGLGITVTDKLPRAVMALPDGTCCSGAESMPGRCSA